MRWLPFLLVLLLPALAAANGGPVAWTSPTGAGGLAPVASTPVVLVSEKLSIRFEDDGARYRVHAEYVLANPGPKASVKYGVPLFWYPPDMDFDAPEDPAKRDLADEKALAYPRSVRIAVGDRAFPCALENVRRVSSKGEDHVEAWCLAEIEIPSGDAIRLTLEYPGSFRFVDMLYTKSPFTEHGLRSLHYDLSPAGHWAGIPKQLDVTIETGLWKEFFHPAPLQGFTEDGARYVLRLKDVDLKTLGSIEGTLDARHVLGHRQRATMKRDPQFQARASSELASQAGNSYGAANVLDGDPGTAWCAGKAHPAVGQWIEIHAAELNIPSYCSLIGYVLVPGYAKNQGTWSRNNRLSSVRLGSCVVSEPVEPQSVKVSERFDTSAVELQPPQRKFDRSGFCIRLTIAAVVEGEAKDTCISEFRPIINCG